MANVSVSYADLQQVASQLTAGQSNLNQELQRLKSVVDGLVSSGFVTDAASGSFEQSYAQFTSGATSTISGIEGMVSFLKNAEQSLSELDSSLARSIAK